MSKRELTITHERHKYPIFRYNKITYNSSAAYNWASSLGMLHSKDEHGALESDKEQNKKIRVKDAKKHSEITNPYL